MIWARGKRHEWIVAGRKKDAESFEAKRRVELDADPLANRNAVLFEDFASTVYEAHAQLHLAASTWTTSRAYMVATLIAFFGKTRLPDFGPALIEAYKARRLADGRRASTINGELRVLKTILIFARDHGYPVVIPKWRRLPERGHGRVKVWTPRQVTELLHVSRRLSPEILGMLVFLANTGCRKGEAMAAEWDWIDFEAGLIRIPANEFWQPKNGKPREVPLSDSCRAWLLGPRAHERWVFPASHGGRYKRFPEEVFRRVRREARLVGGPHTLRHSFASQFLQRCPDLFLLAAVLGHSSTRVTELYSHLLPGHLDRAKNAVDISPLEVAHA